MNLRKLSQQTYYKQIGQKNKEDIPDEEIEDNKITIKKNSTILKKHKKQVSQYTNSANYNSNSSKLFQTFKSFTSSTSPIQRYNVQQSKEFVQPVSQFSPHLKQSKEEQQEVIDRLFRWEKKRQTEITIKQKHYEQEEQQKIQEKPKLNDKTLQKCEQGLRHYFQLNNFVKNKHQAIQCKLELSQLTKFQKLKKGVKIMIEYDLEEIQENEINQLDKEIQCKFESHILQQIKEETQEYDTINKHYRSKTEAIVPPIYQRYEYEIQLKEAKLKEMREKKQSQIEQDLQLSKKYNSTAEQFEYFLNEQQNFLKKKLQFQVENQNKQIATIQQIEQECTFQPELNFTHYKSNCRKSPEHKFNDKINFIEENKRQSKSIYFFKSTLPDLRQQITKKYKEILNKSDNCLINQNIE